jgi:hypothetical protein
MNNYIHAIKELDIGSIEEFLKRGSKWIEWSEPTGKNALHYLCGVGPSSDPEKAKPR